MPSTPTPGGCYGTTKTENCPDADSRDLDIGNSPILQTLPDGKRLLLAGTKDANIIALDPDKNGAVVWRKQIAERPGKSPLWGVVFGGASDGTSAYYPLVRGGLAAVRLATGELAWTATLNPKESNSSAATAIPGVAFLGGASGTLYAVSTADGHILWTYDTTHEVATVNGVTAKGGSMNGPGPVVAGGMLYVGAGYGVVTGITGNALMAFAPE